MITLSLRLCCQKRKLFLIFDVFWYKCTMKSTENNLAHLAEFQKALKDYHLSVPSQKILHQTRLILLLAPTAGGRNTIIQELLKSDDYYFVVSDTTRQPRVNNGLLEQSGREYWFRTEADMLADIEKGRFLEAEIIHSQQVSGISIRELKKAKDHNKIAITDVDVGGVSSIAKAKPDILAIVVLPPSFIEWQQRLSARGPIEVVEYKRRMSTAINIFTEALSHSRFTFVVNDDVQRAARQMDQIVQLRIIDKEKQSQARELAQELLSETKAALAKL